jgi:hypothetical protein
MPTRGSKDPNGRALRGRRAHTTFALLTDPARQIWNSFNNRANAGGADAPEAAVNGCLYDRFKSLYNKTATKPSLVIVPARFKSGTLYSQIPSSNADFTVTRPLNTATRFDSSALIQTGITSGVPRLDYYTSGGVTGCPALLVEPAGTNLALRSEELDNAVWTNALWGNWANATAASSTTIAPDGSTNAEELTFTTNTSSRLQRITGIAASTTYTFSMYVMGKAGNSYQNGIFLRIATGFNNALVAISAATGRVDSTVSNTAWTRYSVTFTTPSSGVNEFNVGITVANSGTNPNATMICWGAQLETGSVATSYIPTTTGTGSRSADVVSVSGAVSGSIGQQSGTIYAEVDIRNSVTAAVLGLDNNSTTDFIIVFRNSSRQITVTIRRANGSLESIITSSALAVGVHKIALGYTNGNYALYINGSLAGTSTNSVSFPTSLTACRIGANAFSSGTGDPFNDRIRAVALYTTRLTNAELATLTQP